MSGKRKILYSIGVLLFTLCSWQEVKAMVAVDDLITLEVKSSSVNDRVVSHVLKVTNKSEHPFSGTMKIQLPPDARSISREEATVSVAPGDSTFVAYRLMTDRAAAAGRKTILYTLFDEQGKKTTHQEGYIDIEQREQIYLTSDDIPIMVINPEDSVRVAVTINNRGNVREEVTLVFNVPNIRNAPVFTEMKVVMEPMEQRRFTHAFLPSRNLLMSGQFRVYVTAMKGAEKTIFGSRTITVQNVFSNRDYIDVSPARSLYPGQGSTDNSLTLSYRQYNNNSNMLQLQGGGYMNLPAGYLHLKGNIYKYKGLSTPMVTNTSLLYKLHENEFTVGNVHEQAELSLYGRGAKILLSDSIKDKTLTFGAIDQNFNLVDNTPWFANYYSFYVQGVVGASNSYPGAKATYIYQRNPYEKGEYNMGSMQWRTPIGENWEIQLDGHGAVSNYYHLEDSKVTGAGEYRYRGELPAGISLNGSAYYSDPYFPGNRKGTLSISQGVSKRFLNDIHTSGSFSYNRTEPKSYVYNYSYSSENSYGNATVSLPRWGRLSTSLFYRYQKESSSSYASHLNEGTEGGLHMASHRLGGQWSWQTPNGRHSFYGTLEAGGARSPLGEEGLSQVKSTFKYSWQWLAADVSYQKGAYYLYEYVMAKQKEEEFYRFTSSASINKNIAKKMSITSSVNFTRDTYQGNVPSMNLNANYLLRDDLGLFTTAYWYQYNFANRYNVFNVQVGLTWNFSKTQPLKGKKSTVAARLYYDHNSNNRYDEGDEPATDYLLSLDNKVFISDNKGEIKYRLVPYGEYTVKPTMSSRWFFEQKKIEVNSSRTIMDIPLWQSGTMRGSITYKIDQNSVEATLKQEGLRFVVKGVTDKSFTRTLITNAEGQLLAFLPVGEYSITLDEASLAEYTYCEEPTRIVTIKTGKPIEIEPFVIKVQSRKVNVKRFY